MYHFVSTILYVIAITVLIANGDSSGDCGANLKWYYFEDSKTLIINGTGEMSNFTSSSIPWRRYYFNNTILENKVTSIGNYAFYKSSSMVSISIPSSVSSIGRRAFSRCTSLTSINISESVSKIGDAILEYCDNLLSIHVDSRNRYYMSDNDGVLFDKQKTTLLQYPVGRKGDYRIPNGVTSVGQNAFAGCTDLSYTELPSTMTSISVSAFQECYGLNEVKIPSTVTILENYCFWGCNNLIFPTIPSQITSIGSGAFQGCKSLTKVTFESDNLTIGKNAFKETGLRKLIIPESVKSINSGAFSRCDNLTTVTYLGTTDICLDNDVFDDSDKLDFICVPLHYWDSRFGGFYSIKKSDSCDEFTSLSNQCYGVLLYNDTYSTIYERYDVTEWKNKSDKCIEYACDNETGLFYHGICLSSDDNEMMCFNDTCQNVNECNPNNYAVKVILSEPFDASNTLLTEDRINSLRMFKNEGKKHVGLQVSDEGKIINIIIFDPRDLSQTYWEGVARKINEIDKDNCITNQYGIFCYSENATVIYSEHASSEPSGAISSHNKMACSIAALFAVVVSLMTLVL